jgi:hypothetical protein
LTFWKNCFRDDDDEGVVVCLDFSSPEVVLVVLPCHAVEAASVWFSVVILGATDDALPLSLTTVEEEEAEVEEGGGGVAFGSYG